MNKIDLVEKKKDLLKVAEEFKDLPGYERQGSLVERPGQTMVCSMTVTFVCIDSSS